MKLPDFESPSGDSLSKSANFGLSKWIFYVKNHPNLSKKKIIEEYQFRRTFFVKSIFSLLQFLNGCNWVGPRTHLGPWLFWSPRNLDPEKFGPWEVWALRSLGPTWKSYVMIFMQRPNFLGPTFHGDQTAWGQNFLGTKKVRGPNEIGDHFSYSLLWPIF